jgi:hypothetical protein
MIFKEKTNTGENQRNVFLIMDKQVDMLLSFTDRNEQVKKSQLLKRYSTFRKYHNEEVGKIRKTKKPNESDFEKELKNVDFHVSEVERTNSKMDSSEKETWALAFISGVVAIITLVFASSSFGPGSTTFIICVLACFLATLFAIANAQLALQARKEREKRMSHVLSEAKIEKRKLIEKHNKDAKNYEVYCKKLDKLREKNKADYVEMIKMYIPEKVVKKASDKINIVLGQYQENVITEKREPYRKRICEYFLENRASTVKEALALLEEDLYREKQLEIIRERNKMIKEENRRQAEHAEFMAGLELERVSTEKRLLYEQREADRERRRDEEERRRNEEERRREDDARRRREENDRSNRKSAFLSAQREYNRLANIKAGLDRTGDSRAAAVIQAQMEKQHTIMLQNKD